MNSQKKMSARALRQSRVRKRVLGSDARPRLSVFRSNRHLYVQVISDESGRTLASASTLSSQGADGPLKNDKVSARHIGLQIGAACQSLGIHEVVFDRNGYLYHGVVRAVAESAREAGLKF